MAGRKENLKALFTNTRSRVIIFITAALLITLVIIGFLKLKGGWDSGPKARASVGYVPAINSTPGTLNPTQQYVQLQQEQNVSQAQAALQTGGSAIPTIIRTQQYGTGRGQVGPQEGSGSVGFSTLAMQANAGPPLDAWIQSVRNSHCSKESITSALNQGVTLKDLHQACTCAQLKNNGYGIKALAPVCSCKELRSVGYSLRDLKDAGFDAGYLRRCGFSACDLRGVGFTALQLKNGGFSDGELKGAGFSANDVVGATPLPNGITLADVEKAGCNPVALQRLKAAGVTAATIRHISGCSINQLRAVGYGVPDLKNAGFSNDDLKAAGFSDAAIAAATPINEGISEAQVKAAGCNPAALQQLRLEGVSAATIRRLSNCSAAQLKAAGFGIQELKNAGFSDSDLKGAGFSAQDIAGTTALPTGISIEDIKKAGCDPLALQRLKIAGVTAATIHTLSGCSLNQLKAVGYGAPDLKNAGYNNADLKAAGFSNAAIAAATPIDEGISEAQVKSAGCQPAALQKLRLAGVSAATIRRLSNCSAAQLKAAGFSAEDLKNAGFTAGELKAAGFSAADLKNAGFSAAELKDAGFSAAELKNAGFSASDLKAAGFSAADLKNAGFSASDLKNAGFTASDLKNAGFSADQLREAGFSATQLRAAGFSAKDLHAAGFSAQDLQKAGYSLAALKNAGYSPSDLKNAGFSANQLKAAGFSDAELSNAGLTPLSPVMNVIGPAAVLRTVSGPTPAQVTLTKQQQQMADQQYQQKLQSRTALMQSAASSMLSDWKRVTTQVYTAGNQDKNPVGVITGAGASQVLVPGQPVPMVAGAIATKPAIIKAGDVMFAVLDTSVNSDEPGPILATLVSGRYKGAKLIGSFNLPANADKMVITFNSMSVPGAPHTTSINAYAIDPNTARTALASSANHHYLYRYGSLFASSFIQGFGNAIQSATTSVTISGTGSTNITVSNGIGRSTLQNAVIGLATVGQAWGQFAQQNFSTPTTVLLCSGTGIGVLFTQDLTSL